MSNPSKNEQAPKESLIVGEGVTLQGKIVTPGAIRLDGRVDGEVVVGDIYVGSTGVINGTLTANNAEICGNVSEKIFVKRQLTLRSTASARGSIEYGALEIELGATIDATVAAFDARAADGQVRGEPKESSVVRPPIQAARQSTPESSTSFGPDKNESDT